MYNLMILDLISRRVDEGCICVVLTDEHLD